jgi:signal transduction histidine kinase
VWLERRQVAISVRDRGPGIPESQRADALRRFWRAEGQDPSSGSGLGLTIASSLARRAGGMLELRQPSEGSGLEVVLLLPTDASAWSGS